MRGNMDVLASGPECTRCHLLICLEVSNVKLLV